MNTKKTNRIFDKIGFVTSLIKRKLSYKTMEKYLVSILVASVGFLVAFASSHDASAIDLLGKISLRSSSEKLPDSLESSERKPVRELQYSPKVLIIYCDSAIGKQPLMDSVKACGAKVIYDYRSFSAAAIEIPEGKTLEESIKYFEKIEGVLSVNKDYIYHLDEDFETK